MAHSLQGVYSPLPQSLSDSDSEKEISMEPVCTNYGNSGLKNIKHENSCRQNGHLSFSSMNDDILKVKRVNPKMSTLRKTAFVFSILLCFLPIIIFLWVLPCSDSNTCPISISNWEYQQDNIELQGKVNLIHGAFQNSLNLALMYKGSLNSQELVKNGIISFVGSNGVVAWVFQQDSYPTGINCSIIDVNGDGYADCLVTDEIGLKVIESVTGEALWHANSGHDKPVPHLDMPVKIEDVDKDGVDDLLSIYEKQSFILISGKTGLAFSNIKLSQMCNSIGNLTSNVITIKYGCIDDKNVEKYYEISVNDLKSKYHNSNEQLYPKEVANIVQITYETGGRKLVIENHGHCPDCQGIITLFGANNASLKVLQYQNAYVMTPVPYSFQSTNDNIVSLKGHIHGFILKIWEWKSKQKLPSTSRLHKRSLPSYNRTYYLNEVSEIVVLITFNETDIHIINASLTERYQICPEPTDELSWCQPDFKKQKDSLLISDMDRDNSLELISYSSSYVKEEDKDGDIWRLVSFVKVLRLENELPKLYETK